MNDDNFKSCQDQVSKERQGEINSQQFRPGGFPGQPPRDGGQPPRVGGQPLSAPPSFTPQRRDGGRDGMDARFGRDGRDGRDGRRNPERELRRCLNRFTFIWLVNGNGFWFFPISVNRQSVQGFRWSQPGWRYDRINLRRISDIQCF